MAAVSVRTLNLNVPVALVGNNDASADLLLEDYLVLNVTIMGLNLQRVGRLARLLH